MPRYRGRRACNGKTHVAFRDHSSEDDTFGSSGECTLGARGVELPSSTLLQLHAALAYVLHISGAARILATLASPDESGNVGRIIDNEGTTFGLWAIHRQKIVKLYHFRLQHRMVYIRNEWGHKPTPPR